MATFVILFKVSVSAEYKVLCKFDGGAKAAVCAMARYDSIAPFMMETMIFVL
jgi:hypothetical protein